MAELNLKNFPDTLHLKLKVRAAEESITLRELVIETLEGAVAPPTKRKSPTAAK